MSLDDFNQEFGVRIESEEVETLAGALLQAFGELPASGAAIERHGLRFTVETLEHNRITRVLVERLPQPAAAAADTGGAAASQETTEDKKGDA
ncbi:MAG: Magnesium and cobalt efflux protein CorC [Candidatus Accumulibacter adjunctus]|uniref:Magnesium and cobalt efflux protein CorC n=1 Tax=Candidatus Accumulibacter adjunctus TaxID=1454001 RepID=A0A011NL40_9PROT|nr:MAG: Magnesium and cobalt efflux protein CorC [Candidatus Accumulibacter adjunctus]